MLEKQDSIIVAHMQCERAIDELRRSSGIIIQGPEGRMVGNYPVEFLSEEMLTRLRSESLFVLITGARAKSLGLPAADCKIEAGRLTLAQIMAICDPLADQEQLPALDAIPATLIDSMALKLAKYASLLPALLLVSEKLPPWMIIGSEDVAHYIKEPLVDIVETASATLPLEGAEDNRIISFRSRYSTAVHLALVVGEAAKEKAPLTRIHSSCTTGDILGSLRCDCGDQLALALSEIRKAGSGILIYLHQEGRGIGITNKLRAYKLQEQGIDTYEANLMLGFEEDERDFSIAGAMLKKLGVASVRLLTNNPEKLSALEKTGITVAERVKLVSPAGRHNHAYLEAKGKKAGHLF